MAIAPTAATEEVTVSLPVDVLRELDELADGMGRSRNDLMVGAVRGLLFGEQRWRELQASAAEHARNAGLFTEDDVEEYLDSLPDEPA